MQFCFPVNLVRSCPPSHLYTIHITISSSGEAGHSVLPNMILLADTMHFSLFSHLALTADSWATLEFLFSLQEYRSFSIFRQPPVHRMSILPPQPGTSYCLISPSFLRLHLWEGVDGVEGGKRKCVVCDDEVGVKRESCTFLYESVCPYQSGWNPF